MIGVGSATILVVDDNRINRRILEAKLGEAGHTVLSVESGREALDLLEGPQGGEVNLVLLDIMMPEMDGVEVLQRLRQTRSAIQLPVIMTTAMDKTEDVVGALEKGANDYVTKPVNLPVLLSRVTTQLSLQHVHRDLRDSHRSLVQAARMESVALLAAGVAHEIRNPLAEITMGLQALPAMTASGSQAGIDQVLGMLTQAAGRAEAIVQGLIDAAAQRKLQPAPGDLNALVAATRSLLDDEELTLSQVQLQLDLDDALPATRFDADELQPALLHVILNGMQAMPNGGTLRIDTREEVASGIENKRGSRSGIRLQNAAQASVIEITDEGPGMSEETLDRIFDPFFTTRPAGAGTGLGLTVVKKVMELHGGVIQVRNRSDRSGLAVKLLLPVDPRGFL